MYLSPTADSVASLMQRGIAGQVTMLNLLRFRDVADYSDSPDLAPEEPISGEAAYQIYSAHTLPLLAEVGGSPIFVGQGGPLLIGPPETRWDRILLVQYPDIEAFIAMTQSPGYHAGAGHRTAALDDSRLLPME